MATMSSGRAMRNGILQPNESKLSCENTRVMTKKPPEDRIVPIGEPICGIAA